MRERAKPLWPKALPQRRRYSTWSHGPNAAVGFVAQALQQVRVVSTVVRIRDADASTAHCQRISAQDELRVRFDDRRELA